MIFICVFALLIRISVQELNKVEPATANGENQLSSVNFIYFYGPPPNAEQIRAVREVLKNEDEEIKNANPLVRYLVAPERRIAKLEGESNQHTPTHNHIGSLRKRRNASPTFKKGFKSSGGGGGGCCSSCGQCGGGCSGGGCGGGGGHSGSYSQSTSYSSSSSGSYNSYGKKK